MGTACKDRKSETSCLLENEITSRDWYTMKQYEKKRMTLNQLARELNVSRTTLYNIMHQKGSFSVETKERVDKALKEYDFRLNNHARNLAKGKEYKIAFVGFYSTRFGYFFEEIQAGISRAEKILEDDGLQIITAYSDREKPEDQIRDLQRLEEEGIENFIIFCYHYEQVENQIRKMISRGKNIILFSRRIPDVEPLCSVGCNDGLSGQMMAELLEKLGWEGARVQMFISEHNHRDKLVVGERLEGFYRAREKTGKTFEFLEPAWVSPVPEIENKEIRKILEERNPDIVLDFVCNLQDISAFLEEKKREKTVLLGYDVYPEIVPYIKRSTIDAVIYQDLPSQSYKAIELMFNYICYGEKPEKRNYYLPLNVVFSSNCEYFESL